MKRVNRNKSKSNNLSRWNQMKRAFWITLNVFSTPPKSSSRKLFTTTSSLLKIPHTKTRTHTHSYIYLNSLKKHTIKTPNHDNKPQITVLQYFHKRFLVPNTKT